MLPPDPFPHIVLLLKEFLLIETCPPEWKDLDLYLVRDDQVVFYVGQSYTAFDRVWQHIFDAFKGRSTVGRFLLCNWPICMEFTVELMSSQSNRFNIADNHLSAAERLLIEQHTPCFNRSLNSRPSPLPSPYNPPTGPINSPRTPRALVREARLHVKARHRKAWMAEEGLD
jgi:hypothetical protein